MTTETWHLPDEIVAPWLRAVRHGQRLSFHAGEALYRQGDHDDRFYLILAGRIRVAMLQADGSEFLLEYMGRGAITGEGAAFDDRPRFSTALATESVDCVRFEAKRLEEAFRAEPSLAHSLLRVTGLKQRVLARRIQALSLHQPQARVAELLLRISSDRADHRGGQRVVRTRLTHQQIAEMTGISRVTVTRVIGRLRKSGVIDVEDGMIVIRAPERLMA